MCVLDEYQRTKRFHSLGSLHFTVKNSEMIVHAHRSILKDKLT